MSSDSHTRVLERNLILDELFDLTLYEGMRLYAHGDFATLLDELIVIERRHFLFWEGCFGITRTALNVKRRIKLFVLLFIARFSGVHGMHLILEATRVFGIRKYLSVWNTHKDKELGLHIAGILRDEIAHEDWIASRYNMRTISPERVRSVFLGFNDGSVEILGAITGFFVAFREPALVLVAGTTVAVAGAISMAAGAYVSSSSEAEVRSIEDDKARFLDPRGQGDEPRHEGAFALALVVGGSYFIGAFLPILPVLFGATNVLPSILSSGVAILLVSYILAFLSGMNAGKRMTMNIFMICAAVSISALFGYVVRMTWGVVI